MKQKTKKAASKRFAFSAKGKAKRRPVGQSHFNSRDDSNQTRAKRPDASVAKVDQHRLTRLLPYN